MLKILMVLGIIYLVVAIVESFFRMFGYGKLRKFFSEWEISATDSHKDEKEK